MCRKAQTEVVDSGQCVWRGRGVVRLRRIHRRAVWYDMVSSKSHVDVRIAGVIAVLLID